MSQEFNNTPTEFDKFWERLQDILIPILVPLFALIGDAVVIISIIYFIIHSFAWYWIAVLILITGPILYIFNKGGFYFIKELFKKK